MIHRGELVEEAVRQSGMTLTEVAKRLGKSRRHLYNLFEDPQLSIDTILQIGKIIRHDFTENVHLFPPRQQSAFHENNEPYTPLGEDSAEYWKNKYLLLLEKYNALLEERLG
jgi:predicted transcriptional regulator